MRGAVLGEAASSADRVHPFTIKKIAVIKKKVLILTLREVVTFHRAPIARTTAKEFVMKFEALKVGELAKRTGLTVRTLHHYDEIGLLRPSLHTESGHRLYTLRDLARLQQIVSLRQLGFSLDQVRECLDRPDFRSRYVPIERGIEPRNQSGRWNTRLPSR